MNSQNCYNSRVDFTKWINDKFIEWRGETRQGVSDFAAYLGVSQPAVSKWLNGDRKTRLSAQSISKLAGKYPEVYDVLGLPSPLRNLPPDLRTKIESAQAEVDRILAERHITGEMPEAEQIAIEIFEKHGFKFIEKRVEPD